MSHTWLLLFNLSSQKVLLGAGPSSRYNHLVNQLAFVEAYYVPEPYQGMVLYWWEQAELCFHGAILVGLKEER